MAWETAKHLIPTSSELLLLHIDTDFPALLVKTAVLSLEGRTADKRWWTFELHFSSVTSPFEVNFYIIELVRPSNKKAGQLNDIAAYEQPASRGTI